MSRLKSVGVGTVAICSTIIAVFSLVFAGVINIWGKGDTTALTMTVVPFMVTSVVTSLFTLIRTEDVREKVNGRMSELIAAKTTKQEGSDSESG